MPNRLLFLYFLFASLSLSAQTEKQMYERDFKRAIASYNQADYLQVINGLIPLTSSRFSYSSTPYAHYYYALASMKLNRIVDGRMMLQQLVERFPKWEKTEEVNYLYADFLFKEKKYENALTQLVSIRSNALSKDVEALKNYYIKPLQEIALLKNLYKIFPSEKTVNLALINALKQNANTVQDKELLNVLAQRNGIQLTQQSIENKAIGVNNTHTSNWKKGYYQIAVMFPFKAEELFQSKKIPSNQYVYDLYEGMKMAADKLQNEGISIKFANFDIENNVEAVNSVIQTADFQQSDLIVGPLHQPTMKIVKEYAQNNKVIMLNPVSLANEQLQNQQFMLNIQPSIDKQATAALVFGQAVSSVGNKKVAIYVGSNRRDTLLASLYKTKAMAAGFQIIDYRKTREKIDSTASISATNKPAHIAVFSSNHADGQKVLSMMSKRKVSAPLLANITAFDVVNNSGNAYQNKAIYFIDTEFADNSRQVFKDFTKKYFAQNNTLPSSYAIQGYDTMLYFGRMLHKHKEKLRDGLNIGQTYSDLLMNGFNFKQSNENQVVPILQFDGNRFINID